MKRKFTIMTLGFVFLMAFASISKAEVSTPVVSAVNNISTTTTTKEEISLMKQKLSVLNTTNCLVTDGCTNALNLAGVALNLARAICQNSKYGSEACDGATAAAIVFFVEAVLQCSESNNLETEKKLFFSGKSEYSERAG